MNVNKTGTIMASIVNRINSNGDAGLSHCWTLEKLLDESQITGELNLSGRNLKEYPEYARQCDMEDTIVADLSRNKFVEIPCDVCNYCSMEWLNCYSNIIKFIPNSIVQLQNLVYLNLSRNQLSAIPLPLCQLTQLQVLIASHNRLTELPDDLNRLENLTELDASCNEISQLPDNWDGLQALRRLDIRRNCLTALPTGLSGLRLQYLNVSCNSLTRLPTEFHQLVSLEEFRIEYNPLIFPPLYVCRKGLNHVLKFLALQATRQQNKHTVRTKYKRPSALLSNHFEKTSRSCDNFDQCYITSHVLESGYSTADSCEKLRLPSCEDSSETPCKSESLPNTSNCITDECQQAVCFFTSLLEVDNGDCIEDEFQQTINNVESQLEVDDGDCIEDEFQQTIYNLESQLEVYNGDCIEDEFQQTINNLESQLGVDNGDCIEDESQQTKCYFDHWSGDNSIMKTEPLLADSRHMDDEIPVSLLNSKYSSKAADETDESVKQRLTHCISDDSSLQTSRVLRSLIERNLKIKLSSDLSAAISDGVYLCQLANRVRPNSVSLVNIPTPDSMLTVLQCEENVRQFLKACRNIGVSECHLCSCDDVVSGLQHPEKLLLTVQQLVSYPPVTFTDHVASIFCLIVFFSACALLIYFPLPN